MIISLGEKNLVDPILEVIHQDRIGVSGQDSLTIIRGVVQSFVDVEKLKKYNNLDVSIISFTLFSLKIYFLFHLMFEIKMSTSHTV